MKGIHSEHCQQGSVDCLDLLLSNGANFRLVDNDNRLALHHAASQGHYPCVFTLVGFGSDSNAQDLNGATPLHLAAAASNCNALCVQYLLQHRADPRLRDKRGFTAIHYAVAGGNQAALEALLNASSAESQSVSLGFTTGQTEQPALTPIHLAAYHGHSEILRLLLPLFPNTNIQEDSGKTPLDLAAYEGHKQCIDLLLQFGALVSVQDSVTKRTPIHCAAAMGHADCLALLLQSANDTDTVNCYDAKQRTALALAVANNHSECAILLLKYKADCNLPDINKHTPLFRTVINERDNQLVKLLLKHGARVAVQDVNGKTPLHLAAACGRLYALAALVKAEPTAAALKDDQGCTVLHWACYNGNCNCVEYLLNSNVFDSLEGKSTRLLACKKKLRARSLNWWSSLSIHRQSILSSALRCVSGIRSLLGATDQQVRRAGGCCAEGFIMWPVTAARSSQRGIGRVRATDTELRRPGIGRPRDARLLRTDAAPLRGCQRTMQCHR